MIMIKPIAWARSDRFIIHYKETPDRPENSTSDVNEWKALYSKNTVDTLIERIRKAEAVKVKPLEWRTNGRLSQCWSVIGYYEVQPCYATAYEGQWLLRLPRLVGVEDEGGTSLHLSEEAAFAAAQADYEQRILSALSVPVPAQGAVKVKPLEWEEYVRNPFQWISDYYLVAGDALGRHWVHHRIRGDLRGNDGKVLFYKTSNEAKAAAQADHETCILSAPPPIAGRERRLLILRTRYQDLLAYAVEQATHSQIKQWGDMYLSLCTALSIIEGTKP